MAGMAIVLAGILLMAVGIITMLGFISGTRLQSNDGETEAEKQILFYTLLVLVPLFGGAGLVMLGIRLMQ